MTDTQSLDDKLDELAEAIVDDALRADVGLDLRLDALKVVGGYRHASLKAGKKEEDAPGGFATWVSKIKEAEELEQ